MRQNSTSSMGAMHPVIFFLLIYGIALFLALFVCRTVYYAINGDEAAAQTNLDMPQDATAVAYR
jgi:hypothetical protein